MKHYVGLKIVAAGESAGFMIAVEPGEPARIMALFDSGNMPGTLGNHNVRCSPDTAEFRVRSDAIQVMYSISQDPRQLAAGPPPPGAYRTQDMPAPPDRDEVSKPIWERGKR